MGILETYLLVINIVGFIMFLVNTAMYNSTNGRTNFDRYLTYISFLGGSLGIVIAMLIFDRRFIKDTMMSRVFVYSMVVIQIVLYLLYRNGTFGKIYIDINTFINEYRLALYYLLVINSISFVLFGIDKSNALNRKSRIPNVILISSLFIGGTIGGFLGMKIFHHKTSKDYYSEGIKFIALMHLIVIFYLLTS